MKNNKGITMISLILTIIVMIILVGVVLLFTVGEEGIIKRAQNAEEIQTQVSQEEEKDLYNMQYYVETGIRADKEITWEIKELSEKTGVSSDKFVIYYDAYNIKQNKQNGNKDLKEEYVLYRIDKTTKEERQKLKEQGVFPLKGDVNLDGKITMEDYYIIEEIVMYYTIGGKDIFDANGVEYMGDYYAKDLVAQVDIGDFDCDGCPDPADMGIVEWLALQLCPLEDYNWCLEKY